MCVRELGRRARARAREQDRKKERLRDRQVVRGWVSVLSHVICVSVYVCMCICMYVYVRMHVCVFVSFCCVRICACIYSHTGT